MPPPVSAIVLSYNSRALLDACLGSLLAQTPVPEILLVDNASTDDSVAYVRARFPAVRVLANAHNLGFAEGNNVGLRAAQGEFLFTVNPDTETAPGALAALAQALESEPRLGMAAPKVLSFYDRTRIDSAGLAVDRAGVGLNLLHGKRDPGEVLPRPVFGASAGAALYRRAMLDRVGLFDPDYFAYYEDVDLAWRARLAGWTAVYVPQAVVYHIHGASFSRYPARRLYLLGRNKWWTIVKNYPLPWLALFLPWILARDAAGVLYGLAVRREAHSLRGRLAALSSLSQARAKRRAIQRTRLISVP